jgi:hypothetical protein
MQLRRPIGPPRLCHFRPSLRAFSVVTPLGLEPRTCGLKVRCSAIELEGRSRMTRCECYRARMDSCHTQAACSIVTSVCT